jgi:hypothetical protein
VDKNAIGTDHRVMRELSQEIPEDPRWKSLAYQVRNKKGNQWNSPRLTPAYSGHFADLPAYFNHISEVASIMSHTGRRIDETKEPVQPVTVTGNRRNKGQVAQTNNLDVTTTNNPVYEPDERSRESDDEDEVCEETQTNSLSAVNFSKPLLRIFEATGVDKTSLDQIITREEFGKGTATGLYEHKPRTFAGLKYHLDHDYSEKKGVRLRKYVQSALDRLCDRFGIEAMSVTEKEIEGCPLGIREHQNQGSHTAITCIQSRETIHVPCMMRLNEEAAQLMTKESLAKQCQEQARESCKSGSSRCAEKGFKNCKAMKQHYFRVVAPPQLIGSFETLEGHFREKMDNESKRQNSSVYQMSDERRKQLMLSIIIQSFTAYWNGPDHN